MTSLKLFSGLITVKLNQLTVFQVKKFSNLQFYLNFVTATKMFELQKVSLWIFNFKKFFIVFKIEVKIENFKKLMKTVFNFIAESRFPSPRLIFSVHSLIVNFYQFSNFLFRSLFVVPSCCSVQHDNHEAMIIREFASDVRILWYGNKLV